MKQSPELLSPAGSIKAFKAAIQNGADAVYLGGKGFNARQYASNFDDAALERVIEYAHIRGAKVYVTVNILVADREMAEALNTVEYLYDIGADAVIVQDIGLAAAIKQRFPDLEIHGSTQMTIHNLDGLRMMEQAGISRVVIAREVTAQDIKSFAGQTGVEIETFVQGALCMSYSGQCLMSSMIGGRSGNRGRCAQPCRKEYELVELEGRHRVHRRGYLLSPRDLFTMDGLGMLIDAGVKAFKIEGRMKRPEYVAVVTSAYRKAIDDYMESGSIEGIREAKERISSVFYRGFTRGFVLGAKMDEFLSGDRPDSRGVPIGIVKRYDSGEGKLYIRLEGSLSVGDGIAIERGGRRSGGHGSYRSDGQSGRETGINGCTGDAETGSCSDASARMDTIEQSGSTGDAEAGGNRDVGGRVDIIELNGRRVDTAQPGDVVAISFETAVERGRRVYKTYDYRLMKELAESYQGEIRLVPVSCAIRLPEGEIPELYVWDRDGHSVKVVGQRPVEKARSTPTDSSKVRAQLEKTGGTPFYFDGISVDIDEGIFISLSELNSLRREALDQLAKQRATVDRPRVFRTKERDDDTEVHYGGTGTVVPDVTRSQATGARDKTAVLPGDTGSFMLGGTRRGVTEVRDTTTVLSIDTGSIILDDTRLGLTKAGEKTTAKAGAEQIDVRDATTAEAGAVHIAVETDRADAASLFFDAGADIVYLRYRPDLDITIKGGIDPVQGVIDPGKGGTDPGQGSIGLKIGTGLGKNGTGVDSVCTDLNEGRAGLDLGQYCSHFDIDGYCTENISMDRGLYLKLPVAADSRQMDQIERFLMKNCSRICGVEVSNPGQILLCRRVNAMLNKQGIVLDIHGGESLNIFNSLSANVFSRWGCSNVTLSPELNLTQIRDLIGSTSVRCQVLVYGRHRLMTLEYQLLHGLAPGSYGLRDKKGMIFPVNKDGTGRAEVFNSQLLFMLDRVDDIIKAGVCGIKLVHRDEDIGQLAKLITQYRNAALTGVYDTGLAHGCLKQGITRGHFYRGVD